MFQFSKIQQNLLIVFSVREAILRMAGLERRIQRADRGLADFCTIDFFY